jgi:hypothetical protein
MYTCYIALQHEKADPFCDKYTCASFQTDTYRDCYSYQMYPIDIQGLKPTDGCLPPKIVKLRGRPKIARLRKGQYRRKKATVR